MRNPKLIPFTAHARQQTILRGAEEAEVEQVIRRSSWEPAKRGKQQARRQFTFGKISPTNQQGYKFKTVEAVFVDEPESIVIITVKVYYSN